MSALAATRVMTVEDDPIVRADLRLILEDAGFEVCADARDGVEAVELARHHRPDLILLDLVLPSLDGVEATRRILGEQDVPIVAFTGHANGRLCSARLSARAGSGGGSPPPPAGRTCRRRSPSASPSSRRRAPGRGRAPSGSSPGPRSVSGRPF